MTRTNHNRRTFISSAAAVTALGGTPLLAVPIEVRQGAEGFLKDWVAAWNARNAHALAALHTEDCVTAGGMPSAPMATPAEISMFPGEQVRLSRRWAESGFSRLVHFNELERGGHFVAMEQPERFVDEVRETFESLR